MPQLKPRCLNRSVIVVPYIQRERLKLDRVEATSVKLLIVPNEETKNDGHEIRGVQMADHLARHDVKVEVEAMPARDIDVASAILFDVADYSASLIVMGGYGHARIREFILGGVARDMLKSMTLPMFMSHRSCSCWIWLGSCSMRLGLYAFAVAAVFLGAAIYIGVVELPDRLKLGGAMLKEWTLSFRRGHSWRCPSSPSRPQSSLPFKFRIDGDVRWIMGRITILASWPYA